MAKSVSNMKLLAGALNTAESHVQYATMYAAKAGDECTAEQREAIAAAVAAVSRALAAVRGK